MLYHAQKNNHVEVHHSSTYNHNTSHQDKLFLDTKNQNANFLILKLEETELKVIFLIMNLDSQF